MSDQQIIETYLQGWKVGDGELSLSVTAESFYYNDPNTRTISRSEFVGFVENFKQAAIDMGAEENTQPFLEYSDTVITEENGISTIWCWWKAVGTDLEGCALIKADTSGILHEKIAYYSKLP